MNSTQISEGMNNVFKKRFRRKLGLSELLVECDKVSASLRENELDEDFSSRRKNPVTYSNLPLLKTAAESYTRTLFRVPRGIQEAIQFIMYFPEHGWHN